MGKKCIFSTRLAVRNNIVKSMLHIEGVLQARNDVLSTFFTEKKTCSGSFQGMNRHVQDVMHAGKMHPENVLQDRKGTALRNSTSKVHCRENCTLRELSTEGTTWSGHFKDKK